MEHALAAAAKGVAVATNEGDGEKLGSAMHFWKRSSMFCGVLFIWRSRHLLVRGDGGCAMDGEG